MKRLFLCLLALLLTASLALTSCGDRGPVVMEYEGVRLTEDIYRYWLSCYKAQFAYDLNGENQEEIAALIDSNIKKSLVCVGLFNRYGLQLSSTAREQIDRGLDRLIENIGNGDRAAFNREIAEFGIDCDGLKIAFTYEQMGVALREYLFGKQGVYSISEEQMEEYYRESYARVYMIYISTVDFATDEDDLRIWDSESGSYVYEEKTGEALAAQNEKARALREALATVRSEEEFRALAETYTEDPSTESYPGGYYFTEAGDYSDYVTAVPRASLDMEIGEICEVKSEIGLHFLYRVAPEEGGWKKGANEDFFEGFDERVRYRYFELAISAEVPNVAVFGEVKETVDFSAIPMNWELYW